MCPVCKRDLAPTLSICLTCGAMINDTVREELETKISRSTEAATGNSGRLSAKPPGIKEPPKKIDVAPPKQHHHPRRSRSLRDSKQRTSGQRRPVRRSLSFRRRKLQFPNGACSFRIPFVKKSEQTGAPIPATILRKRRRVLRAVRMRSRSNMSKRKNRPVIRIPVWRAP
jgi:hypothetical protein